MIAIVAQVQHYSRGAVPQDFPHTPCGRMVIGCAAAMLGSLGRCAVWRLIANVGKQRIDVGIR